MRQDLEVLAIENGGLQTNVSLAPEIFGSAHSYVHYIITAFGVSYRRLHVVPVLLHSEHFQPKPLLLLLHSESPI